MLHVGGEGAETLLDTLLVADVGKDLAVDGDAGIRRGRDVHAALDHECQEADGFEGHGFAAGVGAG